MPEFNPVQTNQMPRIEKVQQRFWAFISWIVFRSTPWFARSVRRLLCRLFGAKVAKSASVARRARIDYPWNLSIGDRSSLADGAWIYCLDRIIIGKNCCIGEDVRLLTGTHDIASSSFELVTKPITVGDNCWIATGAIILPGVSIGTGAVVAAGSVVTRNVESWTVVGGNPAKFIKKRVLASV